MQPMGVYVASTGEAQMLPRCVMPADISTHIHVGFVPLLAWIVLTKLKLGLAWGLLHAPN